MKTHAITLVALFTVFAACVENRSSIELTQPCAFPDSCSFPSGGCDMKHLSKPWVDVGIASEFVLYIEADNQLLNNKTDLKPNTNDAEIREYEVTYSATGGPVPGSKMNVLYLVQADSATVIKTWPIMPGPAGADSVAAIRGLVPTGGTIDVVANLIARGRYKDGTSFETAPLPIAFTACDGCFAAIMGAGCSLSCPPSPTAYGNLAQIGICAGP